jgi:dihydroneopterin aldolase
MDTIHIRNLVFQGVHGITAVEENRSQRFRVDVELSANTRDASKSDSIDDAIDYRRVRDIVQKCIEGESKHLLETLAENMAKEILSDPRIADVAVTIQKLDIWKNGIPGVTICRKNSLEK